MNLDPGVVINRATAEASTRLGQGPVSHPVRYKAASALPRGQVTGLEVEVESGLVGRFWALACVAEISVKIGVVLEPAGAEPLTGLWVGLG